MPIYRKRERQTDANVSDRELVAFQLAHCFVDKRARPGHSRDTLAYSHSLVLWRRAFRVCSDSFEMLFGFVFNFCNLGSSCVFVERTRIGHQSDSDRAQSAVLWGCFVPSLFVCGVSMRVSYTSFYVCVFFF